MKDTSMSFSSFIQAILSGLQEKLGENYMVFSRKVRKNNGIELTGIIAKRKDCNASPTIYINDYYRENITEQEIDSIVNKLYDDFQASEYGDGLDLSGFIEFERAKKKLSFKLVHGEKNKELLQMVPHKRFHNLAIVFYYMVQEAPFFGKAGILVYNSHMEHWGIGVEELYQAAFENAPILFPSVIESMQDMMRGIIAEGLADDAGRQQRDLPDDNQVQEITGQIAEDMDENRLPMYVLTNRQKLNGAACMLYPGVLKAFAEKMQKDFYVLPSSVHEVILVPSEVENDYRVLQKIVAEINRTQVAEEEVLSDSVYYYSRGRDKILLLL